MDKSCNLLACQFLCIAMWIEHWQTWFSVQYTTTTLTVWLLGPIIAIERLEWSGLRCNKCCVYDVHCHSYTLHNKYHSHSLIGRGRTFNSEGWRYVESLSEAMRFPITVYHHVCMISTSMNIFQQWKGLNGNRASNSSTSPLSHNSTMRDNSSSVERLHCCRTFGGDPKHNEIRLP